ncbi:MAG: alpha/beta hydrolase [Elainellaceae cyanobacterium]
MKHHNFIIGQPTRYKLSCGIRRFFHIGTWLGSFAAIAGGAGVLSGLHYVNQRVLPPLSKEISRSLQRPVLLGNVKYISATRVRLGASAIPATEGDRDEVMIEAVDISFSPLDALDGNIGLTVTLINPDIYLDQNESNDWLETDLSFQGGDRLDVEEVRLRGATLTLAPHDQSSQSLGNSVTLHQVRSSVRWNDAAERLDFRIGARANQGGRLHAKGTWKVDDQSADIAVTLKNVAIAPFDSMMPPGIAFDAGTLSGQVQAQTRPNSPLALTGTANIKNVAAWVEGEPNPFTETGGHLRFQGQEILVTDGVTRYGKIPFQLHGSIHLQDGLNLAAEVDSVSVPDFMETFDLSLPVPAEGAFHAENVTVSGSFDHMVFAGTVYNSKPIWLGDVELATARTDFTLDKRTDRLHLIDTEFIPAVGGAIAGNASIQIDTDVNDADIALTVDEVPADALAETLGITPAIALGSVDASGQVRLSGDDLLTNLQWRASGGDYPAQGSLRVVNDAIHLEDATIQVAGSPIKAEGSIADGNWHATLSASDLALHRLSPDLPGVVTGQVRLAGGLDTSRLQDIQAEGDVEVANAVDFLPEPIAATLQWDGDRLHIQQATSPGFALSGWLTPRFEGAVPSISALNSSALNLNVRVDDYDLATLPAPVPDSMPVAGRTRFAGQITGTPDRPHLDGHLTLRDFALGAIAFEPSLSGSVQVGADRDIAVNLLGERDRIAAAFTSQNQLRFDVQHRQATAVGHVVGDRLQAAVEQVPLSLIADISSQTSDLSSKLGHAVNLETLDGTASSQIDLDWTDATNPTLTAQIAIANLTMKELPSERQAHHQGDRLTGNLHYQNGVASLTDGHLLFGDSRIRLDGQFTSNTSHLTGQLAVDHGTVDDILTAVQWVETPQEIPWIAPSLMDAVVNSPAVEESLLLDLQQGVEGSFTGNLAVQSSPESGLNARLSVNGSNWQWGDYAIRRIALRNATWNGEILDLPQLRLAGLRYGRGKTGWRSPDTTVSISLDGQQQRGSLQMAHIPLAIAGQLMDSPLAINGEFHGRALWTGDLADPSVDGELVLQNPQMGRIGMSELAVGFDYEDDHLRIGDWRETSTLDTLVSVGRIPLVTVGQNALNAYAKSAFSPSHPPSRTVPRQPSEQIGLDSGGVEQILFSYGLLQPSFSMDDLERFAYTGDVPDGWQFYFSLAQIAPEELQTLLTQEVAVNLSVVDHMLNSSLGERMLSYLGQIVHTPSRQANVQALRAAIVSSVQHDGRLSLLELLRHYPSDEIYVDINQLVRFLTVMDAAIAPANEE